MTSSSPTSAAPLRSLADALADTPAISDVLRGRASVLAVPEPARALAIAALAIVGERRPVLAAVATTAEAERLADDLALLLGDDEVELFPAWETLPFERVSPAIETMGRRLHVLWRLTDPSRRPAVVVTPLRALIQRLGPHVEDVAPLEVRRGDVVDLDELVRSLVGIGYRREDLVEHRGEVAVRGSIVDVFPSTADGPVRIDLWGDEVDRLTSFSVADQRSTGDLEEVRLLPCREVLPTAEVRARAEGLVAQQPWGREQWERLADGQTFDGMESWLPWVAGEERVLPDLLDADAQIVLVEPRRLRDRAEDLLAEEDDLASTLARTWGAVADPDAAHGFPRLHVVFERVLAQSAAPVLHVLAAPDGPDTPAVAATGWDPVVGDGSVLGGRLAALLAAGTRVVVCASGAGSAARLIDRLGELGVDATVASAVDLARPGLWVIEALLARGVVCPEAAVALIGEADITGRRRAHRPVRPRRREAQRYFDDLRAGDHVVHDQHGVARYGGMVTRSIGGVERDYLLLEYRAGDRLYVPTDQIHVVRRYSGGDAPKLSRLSSGEWQKARARAQVAVREIAQELVVLYQRRVTTVGHVFGEDSPWQHELEDAFPYLLTPDQARAIEEVKADLARPVPMDRLICGDVGFGKTEVALRAAFKVAQEGRQVAVLVPTTLLAQQHLQTFSERFAPYPVRVEVLSRFLTPSQVRSVVAGVRSGEVDVVIGTHRLLSEDVAFKDLGLLVIDEEQRFGVSHKERIKAMRHDVDVLTLSATPIPRTLEMSLTGIRDLSLLHTPPAERQPILTYVGEHDERAVAEAIRRELLREGQVFFVHNRVQDIDRVAADLHELVPEARIAVAHGQMDEGSLERIVLDFWEGMYDVLVCTTIIESGIDMPTVNTLVVDRADLLGLGQLHQLRGRVGRAGQRAYAYLFHPADRVLSEDAYERLRTISESTDLGSGFAIAMRDLELRGAGNLLGTTQAGHIAAVGYDLYCQMVTEAVAELKGEPVPEVPELNLDLGVDAHLPTTYIEREDLRLEAYRRLAAAADAATVEDLRAEWLDRFGPLPPAADSLLAVAQVRVRCLAHGITDVAITTGSTFDGPARRVVLSPVRLRASRALRLARLFPKARYDERDASLMLPVRGADALHEVVQAIDELLEDEPPASAADR